MGDAGGDDEGGEVGRCRMSMKGLYKLQNAMNTACAWQDWNHLAKIAIDAGHFELVEKYQPKPGSGWRTIDKRIAKLREEMSNLYGETHRCKCALVEIKDE